MGNNANVNEIMEKVSELGKNCTIDPGEFSDEFEYFKNRYLKDGQTNQLFDALEFRNNDEKELVGAVIKGTVLDTISIIQSLVIIVYRLRNNLFHGIKWVYGLSGQVDNFRHASFVMIKVMDLKSNC